MNIGHIALKHLKQSRRLRMPFRRLMPRFTLSGGAALVHPGVPIPTLQSELHLEFRDFRGFLASLPSGLPYGWTRLVGNQQRPN